MNATFNFTTKREGYGRQGLYFSFNGQEYFLQSVFPNVEEHFGITHIDECFFIDKKEVYTDCNGNETTPYSDLDLFLTEKFKEEIGKVLFENIDLESFDFDFDSASYEEIANWALNYKN